MGLEIAFNCLPPKLSNTYIYASSLLILLSSVATAKSIPPMETRSATSKDNPPTGTKSTTCNGNHHHSKKMTAAKRTSLDKVLIVPLNTLNLNRGGPQGMMQTVIYITWSDGDLFKDIEKEIMDRLEIEPQARGGIYLRIFTNKEMFDKIIGWYSMPFPSRHVVVHSHEDVRPLFSDDTLDENKTGFVDNAVGIFVQNINSMWWLWPNKGKIKPPKRR